MYSAASPFPPAFRPPRKAGRSVNAALCIALAHALLICHWLTTRFTADRPPTALPLQVSLLQMAAPTVPERVIPLPAPAPPAPPAWSPLSPPTVVSTASEAAVPMAAPASPQNEPAPAAVALPVQVTPPPPPAQIPPSAVQYLEPPKLVYPRASVRNGERGRVMVRVFIDIHGWPQQVEVAVSSGFTRLDEAALTAVRLARFKPYQLDGVPVSGWALVPADFG